MLWYGTKGVNKMIEIVYKEEKQEAKGNEEFFFLPKNIRQIGESRGARRIYVEDYVYTFLKRMCSERENAGHAAILLGKYKWAEGSSYLFIQSAMELADMEISLEHMQFTDKVWGEVHDTMEKYFKDQEILGWVLSLPGFNFEINDVILKTHLNHFAGNDKVLFLMEPTEKEEAFYCYESGRLKRESGYYIYYEKNEPMQEYMIAKGKNRSIEETEQIPDRAVNNFRKVIEKKQDDREGKEESIGKPGHNMVYALATCVAVAVLAIGFTYAKDAGAIPFLSKPDQETGQEVKNSAEVSNNMSPTVTPQATQGASDGQSSSDSQDTQLSPTDDPNAGPQDTQQPAPQDSPQTTPQNSPGTNLPSPSPTTPDTPKGPSVASGGIASGTKEYVVQKGDTLSRICMANYGNMSMLEKICDLNNLENAELIYEGQKLILPQ